MRVLDGRFGGLLWLVLIAAASAQMVAAGAKPEGPAQPAPVREIDDPHSGARWFLVKDEEHPGGPGRLVRSLPDEHGGLTTFKRQTPTPIIHAGERILVEEHTDRVDAVLEAVAVGSAVESGLLQARLKFGGRVVTVIAVAPGRARLSAGTGVGR